jgi:CubicO group peptidase (beta-lactamase class C family)
MTTPTMSRRALLALSTTTPLLARPASGKVPRTRPAAHRGVPEEVSHFIEDYRAAMNAPGLTLALANRDGAIGLGAYGYVDVAARTPVTLAHRFEIGSITKSFVGLTVLQLQDEGRLDVQHPILRYLPWLPIECPFGEIRIHHLLTHTSGMPDNAPAIPLDPAYRVRQGCAPGTHFQYCNWGYEVLGLLIEQVDGHPWAEAVARRVLRPIGMNDTAGAITNRQRERIAQSYVPLHDDRPFPRHGAIVPAATMTFESAAGSIASTPADMALYMAMLLRGGAGRTGRVISPEAFKLFTTAFTPAPDFGPTASYGYGLAIDRLDGHVRLRHTGGMASFMSSIHLDLDAGLGAFASVNAQLGYRPNPVAEYALRVLRARAEHHAPPAPAPADEAIHVADPSAYAGTYVAADGRRLEIRAEDGRIALVRDGKASALQQAGADQFIAEDPGLALFALQFGRAPAGADKTPPRVVELGHGADSYVREGASLPAAPTPGIDLAPYCGTYCALGVNSGITRIVQRRGQLWMDGVTPLQPVSKHLFKTPEDPPSDVKVEFRNFINGQAQFLVLPDESVFTSGVMQRVRDVDGVAS